MRDLFLAQKTPPKIQESCHILFCYTSIYSESQTEQSTANVIIILR